MDYLAVALRNDYTNLKRRLLASIAVEHSPLQGVLSVITFHLSEANGLIAQHGKCKAILISGLGAPNFGLRLLQLSLA
jgi:hypothetical protein